MVPDLGKDIGCLGVLPGKLTSKRAGIVPKHREWRIDGERRRIAAKKHVRIDPENARVRVEERVQM